MIITIRDTAIHEASHVLVAIELLKEVEFARVAVVGTELGQTKYATALNDWERIDLGDGMDAELNAQVTSLQRRAMAICVAGEIGNRLDHEGTWPILSDAVNP